MKLEELKDMSPEQIVAAFAAVEQEAAELSEGKSAAEKLVKSYEQQTAEQAEASRKAANEGWIASIAEGAEPKMLPAERPYAAYLLDVLTAPEGVQVKAYTEKVKEGDAEKDVELSPAAAFKKLFELRGKQAVAQLFTEASASASTAEGSELAQPKTAEEAKAEQVRRAKAYAKEHKCPLEKAMHLVLDEDEALKTLCAGVRPEGQAAAAQGVAHFARQVAPK